jgi:hypothetical protein
LAEADYHDAEILAVDRPTAGQVTLRLAGGWAGSCSLRFLGVREARISDSVIGDRWLYGEVHLTADGYGDLQVLLCKSELQIVAPDVGVFRDYE